MLTGKGTPAVLTENFFMDGLDMEFLQSKAGKQAIVDTIVKEKLPIFIKIYGTAYERLFLLLFC